MKQCNRMIVIHYHSNMTTSKGFYRQYHLCLSFLIHLTYFDFLSPFLFRLMRKPLLLLLCFIFLSMYSAR